LSSEAAVRLADSSNHVRLEIALPADVVEHFAGVVADQQAVDGKVAALHVLLRHLRINHAVRVTAVAVTYVRAEGSHFDFQSVTRNQDYAELRADRNAFRKQLYYLFRRCIRGHVVVGGLAAKQQIAHAATHKQRLVAVAAERVANRVGHFAWRHAVIMRQTGP